MGRSFDLIWCGSLVTHLKEPAIVALLKLFRRHLTAGGVVVFTTHGDFVAHRMNEECNYGLPREETPRVRREYATNGYGYADYSGAENYGVSATSPDWVRARVRELGGLTEVFFRERGWDDHQDVLGFVRDAD